MLPIEATLEYGEGYSKAMERDKEKLTINCDKYYLLKDSNPFMYHIHKIYYALKKNEYIKYLKIEYKNLLKGNLMKLLETPRVSDLEDLQIINIKSCEEIINVKIYLKENKLTGIELKTDLNNVYKIGYGEKEDEEMFEEFENEENIILGFGVNANKFRVHSIYCYFTNKQNYYNKIFPGLLSLKAKMDKNKEFKNKLDSKITEMDVMHKLIVRICELPNLIFFNIAKYVIKEIY